jgi:ribosome-associated protein
LPRRIDVAPGIALDERELKITFIQAGGPGGQNVNKVATAAQLRFDARSSLSLPNAVKERLQKLAGSKLTRDGIVVITASRFRSQERNRQDALDRLSALIRDAATPPAKRVGTHVPAGQKRRRLEAKGHRAAVKRARGQKGDE